MVEWDGQESQRRRSSRDTVHQSLIKLREFVGMLSSLSGVELPRAEGLTTHKSIKEFCVGLLEGSDHPWKGPLQSVSAEKRFQVAFSLFLFRKVLPSPPDPALVHRYVGAMGSPKPPVSEDFLRFIRREVPRIFRRGWDRDYKSRVWRSCVSTSSAVGCKLKDGGVRAFIQNVPDGCVDWRLRALGELPCLPDPRAVVMSVPDGGKDRVVTVNGPNHHVLKPLHDLIYDHISRQPWLLRGDSKPSRLKSFVHVPGHVFVSGDYEAATDNIPLEVYSTMLDSVMGTSSQVTAQVWDFAKSQLSKELFAEGIGSVQQKRGQLMGSFLSFPFLCLLNFLAFKYSLRGYQGDVPVAINGDDIVFRAPREYADKWMKTVNDCGFILSKGKTLVDERVFTINSTPFYAGEKRSRIVSFLRAKAYFKKPETSVGMVGQFGAFVCGSPGKVRRELQAQFLRRHKQAIYLCQVSLTRGLGMRVPREVLKMAGLWDREKFYLWLPPKADKPGVKTGSILPGGWERVDLRVLGRSRRKRLRKEEARFFKSLAWLVNVLPHEPPKKSFEDGPHRYARFTPKFARVVGGEQRRLAVCRRCGARRRGGLLSMMRAREVLVKRPQKEEVWTQVIGEADVGTQLSLGRRTWETQLEQGEYEESDRPRPATSWPPPGEGLSPRVPSLRPAEADSQGEGGAEEDLTTFGEVDGGNSFFDHYRKVVGVAYEDVDGEEELEGFEMKSGPVNSRLQEKIQALRSSLPEVLPVSRVILG